jgi:putative glutamine amidotransferase
LRVALVHIRDERPAAPGYNTKLRELTAGAIAAVEALGWTADPIPAAERPIAEVLGSTRSADVIVLLGGEDVDPRLYGGKSRYPAGGNHEPAADRAQIAVALEALARSTPLLGICRGSQLINVALGGTLIQHLPTGDHLGKLFTPTRLVLEDTTDLGGDVNADLSVMCAHHQAIDRLGAGLRIAARSADGAIEAVIHSIAPVTGVQWHPEHPQVAHVQLTALLRRLERQRGRVDRRPALAPK